MQSESTRAAGDILAYRYSVYDLLRRIFLWEVPLEFFAELVKASQAELAGETCSSSAEGPLKNYLNGLPPDDLSEIHREIHIEYTRLFIGPKHLPAPPYESVYRSPGRLMMQDETINVRSLYAKHGFRVTRMNREPDDTVGIELEFMCALSKASLDALQEGDTRRVVEFVSAQREFCELHLSKWMPEFCGDIIGNSTHPFWKSVAEFTQRFLEEDAAEMNAVLEQLGRSCKDGDPNPKLSVGCCS
ncbi:MAG: molecular chaperone TorD family protein [Acidobacteriia bacterium]|nr:molecular chaperone TorD family protein [Terriglobia bacterium]